jgi:glutamyl-tRNA synthetase
VLGDGNRRLSKRDKGSGLKEYREQGYVPEALLNYLALLGWAIADDRDVFTIEEMVSVFDIKRVNANPAKFDAKKCEAINAAHIRRLSVEELAERLVPFLTEAGLVGESMTADERALLVRATPLIQERMTTLSEGVELIRFLFTPDTEIEIDAAAALAPTAAPVLDASVSALRGVEPFEHTAIEAALRAALIEGLGLKPKLAFGPVRVAVTGRRISPPLFESLELLGRDSAVARIAATRADLAAQD